MKKLFTPILLLSLLLLAHFATAQKIDTDEVSIHVQKVNDLDITVKLKNESNQAASFRYMVTVNRDGMEYDLVDYLNTWVTLSAKEAIKITGYFKHPLQENEWIRIWVMNERYEVLIDEVIE